MGSLINVSNKIKENQLLNIYRFLIEHYNLQELRSLCFELGIEYENLEGSHTRNEKARGLLLVAGKQHQLNSLLDLLRHSRPIPAQNINLSTDPSYVEALYLQLSTFETLTKSSRQNVLEKIGLGQRIGFALVTIFITAAAFALYFALRPELPNHMTGDFRIGIAEFEILSPTNKHDISYDLSYGVYHKTKQTFSELESDFSVTIWDPSQVGIISGQTANERAQNAAIKANQIGADILVYGLIDTRETQWLITPEFYIADRGIFDIQELTGYYQFGNVLTVNSSSDIATRIITSQKAELLARIIIGLSFYSIEKYQTSYALLQELVSNPLWADVGGLQLLYVLIGNAAGRSGEINQAEIAYQKALEIDPEYSRAYLGLASIYYIQSLDGLQNDLSAANNELLEKSISFYQHAAIVKNIPPSSNTFVKIDFGLGQCYTVLGFSLDPSMFSEAVSKLESVIEEYNDTKNEEIRIFAGEAHARLGLIFAYADEQQKSIEEYEKAIALLEIYPKRSEIYSRVVKELKESQ